MKKYLISILILIIITLLVLIFFKYNKCQKNSYNIDPNTNTINVQYPSTEYEKLNKEIKLYLDKQIYEFEKITLDKNKTNYYLIINHKEYNYKNYISYIFFLETYTRGVHPIHLIWTINYDTENNKIITIQDIVAKNPNIVNQLSTYSYDFLSKNKLFQNETVKEMLQDGTTPIEDNFKHFLLSKEGLIIYFERYQIAPYYYGDYYIKIPYNKLDLNIKNL